MLLPIIYSLSHRELSTILNHQTYWPNCKADCLRVQLQGLTEDDMYDSYGACCKPHSSAS